MSRYLSILRGINVGGNRKILMADLVNVYESLGFTDLKTYIQSGNVIFSTQEGTSGNDLERRIEQAIFEKFGFEVSVIVRTNQEMTDIFSNNPFTKEKGAEVERLHLTFLKESPTSESLINIRDLQYPPDRYHISAKDVFVFCSAGYSDSKLTNQFFERKLVVRASTRNWKTIVKLNELIK